MDSASDGTCCTANNSTGTHGVLASNYCADESAGDCAANQATNDLRSACPVVSHIASIGLAIAHTSGIGLCCNGAGRQNCEKGCG